jgi:UDP-N-acetylglucosamine 2-epimerase (non-hydrolysing)
MLQQARGSTTARRKTRRACSRSCTVRLARGNGSACNDNDNNNKNKKRGARRVACAGGISIGEKATRYAQWPPVDADGQRGMAALRQRAWGRRVGARGASVLVVAGTRPECIKLAPVVRALDRAGLCAILVGSGQHPQAVRATLAEFDLAPDVELPALPSLPNLASASTHLRVEIDAAIERYRPAAVVVQGDTLTAHAGAMSAARLRAPLAHVEAGLRTPSVGNPFPEEWFRRRIAAHATWHFAPTEGAAAHLRAEGIAPTRIHCVGNPGIDSLRDVLAACGPTRARDANRVLVTLHRRENYDANADVICRALLRLADAEPALTLLLPVHPNPRIAARIRRRLGEHASFQLVEPMAYRPFIGAAAGAGLIISDSGGIQEEAPHLGTPLLVPRANTERPECLATGFVRLTPIDEDTIVDSARAMLAAPARPPVPIDADAPFGDGRAASRIAAALQADLRVKAYA